MNKRILVGSLLCAVGLTTIFGFNTGFAFDFFSKSSVDLPLKSVSFYRGGDMQGSTRDMSVEALDNDSAIVCYENAAWHHEAINVKEYIVPISVLEDIKNIFNNNKLVRCENAPKSKYMVLDGATSSYYFHFEKRTIRFSSTQELPDGSYEALREISKCVSNACEKGQRLPGLVLRKDENGNMPTKNAVIKGKVGIKVVGYKNKNLNISIGNGLEQEQVVALQSKIVEINKPENIVAERITDETIKVSKLYNENHFWKLDKRLPAGKYSLKLGDYTTEFEIE